MKYMKENFSNELEKTGDIGLYKILFEDKD